MTEDPYTKVANEFCVERADVKWVALNALYSGLGGIALDTEGQDTVEIVRRAVRLALGYGLIKRKDEPK